MTEHNPDTVNQWNFDPTTKGRLGYKDAGMSSSNYYVMKSRWLKDQAAKEGKQYKPGFVPKGYTPTFVQESTQNPGSVYWKPDNYARYRPDLPGALWDDNKEYQNYWHNPANVVSWVNRLSVQDEDYELPDGLNKEFIKNQYEALQDFNDDEDDPLYWKPLPLGHEAAYEQNFYVNPLDGDVPIYRPIIEQIYQQTELAARLRREYAAVEQQNKIEEDKRKQESLDWLAEVNTMTDAQSALSKLQEGADKGIINPEYVAETKAYSQQQGWIPMDDGTFAKPADIQPEGGDYSKLYPWQKLYQTLAGSVDMQNEPELSRNIGDVIGAALPAAGIYGMTQLFGTAAVASTTLGHLTMGGAAVSALGTGGLAAGATILGIPALPFIAGAAAVLGIGSALYLFANKDNPQNTVVQNIFRIMNIGAEIPERAVGGAVTAAAVAERGDEVDLSAAYDAAFVTHEMTQTGNFILNAASIISQGIESIGKAFGADWDISSGETATGNEVWLLNEGYTEPQEAETDLGTEGLLLSYDAMKTLGDDRTRDEMEVEWATLTSMTGAGGTLSDFVGQSLFDLTNFIPMAMDKGTAAWATAESKRFAALGETNQSHAFQVLANTANEMIGNPAVDALPMGIQQIVEHALKGWDTEAAFRADVRMGNALGNLTKKEWLSLPQNKYRSISKWARGTAGLPDVLNTFMAKMNTGYTLPNSSAFTLTPGGRLADTIVMNIDPDDTLSIHNVNGTETWNYSKEQLKTLGIRTVMNKDGNLTILGMTKLLKDMGKSTNYTYDRVDTSLAWRIPVDASGKPMPTPEVIDVSPGTYLLPKDSETYDIKIDDKTYTVARGTDLVKSIVDATGKDVPVDKPMRMSESPTIIDDAVVPAAQAQVLYDLLTLSQKSWQPYVNPDFLSSKETKLGKLKEMAEAAGIPLTPKVLDIFNKLGDLTPGAKAMIEAENVSQMMSLMFMMSGNNFELSVNAIKKLIGAADIGKVTKAASAVIGQGSGAPAVMGALKSAWGDGSVLDKLVELHKDTAVQRAYLTKIAKALDISPEKLTSMKPGDIISKLSSKLSASKDPAALDLMQQIASGHLSADSLAITLSPFVGKIAAPITDQGAIAAVIMTTEKNIQDYLIDKYGVKKLDTFSRLSSAKKALLSPLLIAFPYTTWLNNLYSNLGAQFFLTGTTPLYSKTFMDKFANDIGVENLPIASAQRMGLAQDVMGTVSKIALTQNPMDSIGKFQRTFQKMGKMMQAYSKIEEFNTNRLYIAEVMNIFKRMKLPDIPVNIKRDLLAAGMTEEQIKYIHNISNGQVSANLIEQALVSGTKYNLIDQGLVEDAARLLSPNDPHKARVYAELMDKLALDPDVMEAMKAVKDPSELYLISDTINKALEKQINVMLDNSLHLNFAEAVNIMSKEGMAGGIYLYVSNMLGEMKTRLTNSERWGTAMDVATALRKKADFASANRVIRNMRESSARMWTRFNARSEIAYKAMLDVLNAGDADAKAFMNLITSRHARATETMTNLQKTYDAYFDAETNGVTGDWDALTKATDAMMDALDNAEIETLTAVSDIFVKLLGSKVTSNTSKSGLSATDLQRGGTKLMKKMIDEYTALNKLRKSHYDSIKTLTGDARRAASMTFWNEEWQPKMNSIIANFTDGNWQEFFKTKTKLEKTLFPQTETPPPAPKAKAPKTKADATADALKNLVDESNLIKSTEENVAAVHASAGAEHGKIVWLEELAVKMGVPDELRPSLYAWVDWVDDVWCLRTGKPKGSWLAETGRVVVTRKGEGKLDAFPYAADGTTYKTYASARTNWNAMNKLFTIEVSGISNAGTWMREVSRVMWNTPLFLDVDRSVIVRAFGNMDLPTYNDMVDRIQRGVATGEERFQIQDINDKFADSYRRWLYKDAGRIAPEGEVRNLFVRLSDAIEKYVNRIKENFSKVKLPSVVKEVYERVHGFNSAEGVISRNQGRIAEAPAGKIIELSTVNDIKSKYEARAKVVSIDQLIGMHTYNAETKRVGTNSLYDTDIYGDIGKPPTIKQLRDAVNKLVVEDMFNPVTGNEIDMILVDKNGIVARGSDKLLTLLYAKQYQSEVYDSYVAAVKANAALWGFDEAAIKDMTDGVMVLQFDDNFDPAKVINRGDVLPKPAEDVLAEFAKRVDEFEDRVYPYTIDKTLIPEEYRTPTAYLQQLQDLDNLALSLGRELLTLRQKTKSPELDKVISRTEKAYAELKVELNRVKDYNNRLDDGEQLTLGLQRAEEVQPTMPITEYPVGSSPIHMNSGAALDELLQYDVPMMSDSLMKVLGERMEANKQEKYTLAIPEGAEAAMRQYKDWAKQANSQRMAAVLDGAKRITKDIMIDYSRRRGIDQYMEMVFPFQFWFTRSMLMWTKRMVAKPSVMAAAYRYRELQRRNEMTGFPTRLGGKSPIYAPWLPEEMGDWLFVNPFSKVFTPEQLFQPIQNYASLDADITQEVQSYLQTLWQEGTISKEDAKRAIQDKQGTIWEDAVNYVKMNTMSTETDPFTMASMMLNPDPMMNALYQFQRGTPEKISPLPLTRIGNSFEAVGGDNILGMIGAMLSFPEDALREKAGIPQAGEFGDYYVDFWLSNMSVEGKYSVDEIKQAMISRQGAAFEEATQKAQEYIALRTPGTPFLKLIMDGKTQNIVTLGKAFLASFLPSGLFPAGELELRGLKDEYQSAWDDYERGDDKALEKFNEKYPEYETRMMMFQEPTERLRGHLIDMIWDSYTKLPSANQQIASDTLGDAFKAYFLDNNTRDYSRIDERTLTTWARKLGYQAPATPATQQAATDTIDPMKYYPEDTAATIQTFLDERKTRFPDYWVYQGVYFDLPKSEQKAFLKKYPIIEAYWDWKKEMAEQNPTIESYLDDRSESAGSFDTEYDIEAAHGKLLEFDAQLLNDVVYHQATGEPLSAGAKTALNTLFIQAGKPGGDFQRWMRVLLGE